MCDTLFRVKTKKQKIVREGPMSLYDLRNYPLAIIDANGELVYINWAFQDLYNIPRPSMVIGKYSILNDPSWKGCNLRKKLKEIFSGRSLDFDGVRITPQAFMDIGVITEAPFREKLVHATFNPIVTKGNVQSAFMTYEAEVRSEQ